MRSKKISRRKFLLASATSVAGVVLAACTAAPTPTASPAVATNPPAEGMPTATTAAAAPTATTAPAAPATTGNKSARGFVEPPFLADRIASGKLPPIDQRLPDEVFVVGAGTLIQEQYSTWKNGQYGGDINVAATFPTGFVNIAGGATIVRSPSQSTKPSKPNVVSAFSYSDDYTTYKFTIRKGLRWSDGEPVTTEDVRFTFEDIYMDPDVQRPWPTQLFAQGNAQYGHAELTIVDQYNFELKYSKPYGASVADLNSWIPYYDIIFKPAHYLKQFHAKYAKQADLDAAMKTANQTSWVNLLNFKDVDHWNVGESRILGMPQLNCWVLTEAPEERRIYERNPYFWHVDSDGRQLPYIDRVVNNIVIDTNAQNNATMAGKVTIASGGEAALNKMPLYVENAPKFGLKVFTTGSFNNPLLLFLNQDFEFGKADSVWQKLITPDRRFGQAIASAMDPDEINKTVFFGKYGPGFLNNKNLDLAKANQLLDALGMDKRGGDGFRLGPDGQPFIFRITFPPGATDTTPVAELLKEQIGKSGLNVVLEPVDGALFDQRKAANEIMASLAWNDGPAWGYGISEDYLPMHKGPWSTLTWQYFITNGKDGRKPPDYLQEFYDLHTSRKAFPPESDQGAQIYAKMVQWFTDNYVFIPTTGPQVKPSVVDARLQNLPNEGSPFELDVYINAESFWFKA